ncbi:MAG: hypothetical protein KDC07_04670 [Chitinophagaceae bacterium]|nr:hypothetical protein [Chitinophagaceae bacterium]
MRALPVYKRLLSYFVPVLVSRDAGTHNPLLELYYYRGRYQLATLDALYSDGDQYRPLKLAFNKLKSELPDVKNVLVLGTGLASGVQVMSKLGFSPDFTLVEYDDKVLQWAMELMPEYKGKITPVIAEAKQYIEQQVSTYDLLVVDIFTGRVAPAFVTSKGFLEHCRRGINPGGYMVLNYIIQRNEDWFRIDKTIRSVFPVCFCIDDGINRIVIAKA